MTAPETPPPLPTTTPGAVSTSERPALSPRTLAWGVVCLILAIYAVVGYEAHSLTYAVPPAIGAALAIAYNRLRRHS